MLRVIASESPLFIQTIGKLFSPEHVSTNHMASVFRKANTFYLSLKKPPSPELVTWIASEFLPERLYFPFFGYSVDLIHEVGDVIVPNVFLEYQKKLEQVEITKDNRDGFVGKKVFIENFSEQKDYYVEDFGLSLGGIIVSGSPTEPSAEMQEKLLLAYEADVYIDLNLFPALDTLASDEIPTVLLAGVVQGKKHSKYGEMDGAELVLKNILTTIKLLEEVSESETQ